jgi:CubicO group peptidase (beta-lactamase class C family)
MKVFYILLNFIVILTHSALYAEKSKLLPRSERGSIEAVENGLRDAVIIQGEKPEHMNLLERMKYYNAPGVSIAVIDKGQIAWAKGFGSLTNKPDSKPVDSHTLFQAASVSKSLTAVGALLLVQQGKLSLDKDVNVYLKSWKVTENEFTKKNKVTLRRLLSHSAGISVPGFEGYSTDQKIPSLVEILEGKKPIVNSEPIRVIKEPGKEHHYSGGGTTIVVQLIEDVTGEKFDIWMKRHVLNPLGMHESTFSQPLSKAESKIAAHGYIKDGEEVKGGWYIYPELGADGLWTTATDLANFILSIQGSLAGKPGVLNLSLVKEMIKPQIENAGLGVYLAGKGKNLRFYHNGQNIGYISRYEAYPFYKQGFVILINSDAATDLENEIAHSISDVYKMPGFEPIEKEIGLSDPSLYHNFVGIFKNKEVDVEIGLIKGKLYFLNKGNPRLNKELYPEKKNTFFIKEDGLTFEFTGPSNKIDTLIVISPHLPKMIFKRHNQ